MLTKVDEKKHLNLNCNLLAFKIFLHQVAVTQLDLVVALPRTNTVDCICAR